MRVRTVSWEKRHAVIAMLRKEGFPYMPEHADEVERHLERHDPDEPTVGPSLTDDVFTRSDT